MKTTIKSQGDQTLKNTIEGGYKAPGAKIAIVSGRWHEEIVDGLLSGTVSCLKENEVAEDDITLVWAPGAFEIPLICQKLAHSGKYDAIITLGAVVRGGTPHFEYVSGGYVDGITQLCLDTGVPVAFGVLTVDNMEQALERCGVVDSDIGHKGEEAALSALEMINLLKKI